MSGRESLVSSRQEQAVTVAEIIGAASELLADWLNGSVQRTREHRCDDNSCGYASCKLADAIQSYLALADREAL